MAFFIVNFGLSKNDYLQLTEREKIFIRKAYEDKTVKETTDIRNAVYNAIGNSFRKKNSKPQELWSKKSQTIDIEQAKIDYTFIEKLEEEQGKSWVDLIYQANGMRKPEERR